MTKPEVLFSVSQPLTDSVQEQFGLRRKVVVDDIVQQRDVYTAGSNVRHNQHHGFPVHKLADVDLSGRLVEGAVNVRALHALRGQQLDSKTGQKQDSCNEVSEGGTNT